MATLSKNPNGTWRLRFQDKAAGAARRVKITLPASSVRVAKTIADHVGHLISARLTGVDCDDRTLSWLGAIPDELYGRLERAGLAGPRSRADRTATVGTLVEQWEQANSHHKPNTVRNNSQTAAKILKHLGADTPVAGLRAGDAKKFVARLQMTTTNRGTRPSPASIAREIKRARQVFAHAVDNGLLGSNPFEGIKAGSQANPERLHFVSRETAAQVLEACPDTEWRVIFALCRFGGLRCPSEVLSLTWDAVLWSENKLRVASPKTEHLSGGGSRLVPLFPELRPILEQAFAEAADGSKYVVARYRGSNVNLRTQLVRIIERAGVAVWPKVFQNLRATRETELMREHPAHVACRWIGNTEAVALRHYTQVTEADFELATSGTVAQSVAHHRATPSHTEHNESAGNSENTENPEPDQPNQYPHGDANTTCFTRGKRGSQNTEAQSVAHFEAVAWQMAEIARAPGLSDEQRSSLVQAVLAASMAGTASR